MQPSPSALWRARLTRGLGWPGLVLGPLALLLVVATWFVIAGASSMDGRPGPRGEYFVGATFEGTPALVDAHGALTTEALRTNAAVLKSEQFRARWSGVLTVDQPGPHRFAVTSDDGGWLYVDGRLVVDNGGSHGMTGAEATVDLAAGPHEVRVEYAQDGGAIGLEVTFTPPHGCQRALGPALHVGATVWGRPIRPAIALAIVTDLWSALIVLAIVAWPLAWFIRTVARDGSRTQTVAVVGLVVAVTALAAWGIGWGMPDHRGWAADEIIPTDVLTAINQRFSGGWNDLYPPAHYYLLSLVYAPIVIGERLGWYELAEPLPYTSLYLLARAMSAVMAGGTAAALALTGRVLGHSWRAAFMATVVAASAPIFVYYGRTANTDMPYVMWYAVALCAYAAILTRGPSLGRYAWLGAAAALSVGTKDQAYAFFPVIALHLAYRAWAATEGPPARRILDTLGDRFLWTGLATSAVAFALIHNLVFNHEGFAAHVAILTGPLTRKYRMFDSSLSGQAGLLRTALVQLPWCLGWLSLAAAMGGAWIVARRRDLATASVVLLPILSWYVCLIALIGYQYDRFFLGACLGLALLAGVGLEWLLTHLRPRVVGRIAAGAVLVVAVVTGASVPVLMGADSRYAVERWLDDRHRPGGVVAFTGRPEYLPRLAAFCATEVPATVEDLQALHPDLLVTNWHYSLRSRGNPAEWRFYEGLEAGTLGYRRVLRLRSAPWTLLGAIDRLSFGGRLSSEDLTPFTNLAKINPEIRVYAPIGR